MAKTKTKTKKKSPGKAKAAKLPTSQELAAALGVQLKPTLAASAIQKLRKPLPGYVGLIDDAAEQLDQDAALLHLKDVTPAALLDVQKRQKYLASREAVAEAVFMSVYHQRLQVDSEAMGLLQQLARRIESAKEDDPGVTARWKFLLSFLAKFRRTSSAGAAPGVTVPTGEGPAK